MVFFGRKIGIEFGSSLSIDSGIANVRCLSGCCWGFSLLIFYSCHWSLYFRCCGCLFADKLLWFMSFGFWSWIGLCSRCNWLSNFYRFAFCCRFSHNCNFAFCCGFSHCSRFSHCCRFSHYCNFAFCCRFSHCHRFAFCCGFRISCNFCWGFIISRFKFYSWSLSCRRLGSGRFNSWFCLCWWFGGRGFSFYRRFGCSSCLGNLACSCMLLVQCHLVLLSLVNWRFLRVGSDQNEQQYDSDYYESHILIIIVRSVNKMYKLTRQVSKKRNV